ncbi:MAG: hypothetical protein PVH21_01115 [Myxococcales bacterium]
MADGVSQDDAVAPRWALALTVLIAAATAWTGFHPVYEMDPFFQMQLGRAVLEHGSRLVPEPSAISAFTEPCLAFEWLWGVLLLGVLGAVGPAGLTLLTVALTFAAVGTVYLLLSSRGLGRYPVGLVVLTAIGAMAISSRAKARPQVLFMLLLPGLLWLIARYLEPPSSSAVPSSPPRRLLPGLALCVGTVFWAQLHGSFILVPAIFAALVLQDHIDRGFDRDRLRADALVMIGLLLAMLTSAAGLDLLPYVLSHGGGDAVAHIREMAPTDFRTFSPFEHPHHVALFIAWGLGLCGLTRDGIVRVGEILLALLGVVLLSRAGRFAAAATLLTLPLASVGVRNLGDLCTQPVHRRLRPIVLGATVVGSLVLLGSVARTQATSRGPLGATGWTGGAYPRAALRLLDPGPGGPQREILTDYRSGPALAFWSHGRIRHYVDGRTPQYFDDTDYAVEREIFLSEGPLLRGLARYAPSAAVVQRQGSCIGFALHWDLVAVDAMYSTFMPPNGEGRRAEEMTLRGIAPCGQSFLAPDACVDGGVRTLESLNRIDSLSEPAFAAYVRAAFELRCRANPLPALDLPVDDASWGHRIALRRLQAAAAVAAGRSNLARTLIGDALQEGDAGIVQILPSSFPEVLGRTFAIWALDESIGIMDDDAPADLRVTLARLCVEQGDLECARFHGLRAATHAAPGIEPVLRVLAEHHPRAQVRDDAAQWLKVLSTPAP